MIEDLLQLNGLSIGILEPLSYHSQLGKSLKQNLHYFDRETLLSELSKVTEWLAEQTVLEEIALDFRIKSTDSIELNMSATIQIVRLDKCLMTFLVFVLFVMTTMS